MFKWLDAAQVVQTFCRDRQFPFAFIGGVAVQRWGEPRVTIDVDLTVYVGFGNEERFIETFLGRFAARISGAAEFALTRRVLLVQSDNGIDLDVALGGLPFEQKLIERASDAEYLPEVFLHTCSAEDLIVLKAFADREKDWLDIRGVLDRQGPKLDWGYVLTELHPLVEFKEAPQIMDRLAKIRKECAA